MTTTWGETAWGGSLLSRSGKISTGKVEFKAGNQVVVTPANGPALTTPLEEVARVTMTDPAVAPVNTATRDPRLPIPWQQKDIGQVKEAGSGAEEHGVFTVRGAGWGIWGKADSFHFVYQSLVGDFDMMARMGDQPTEANAFVAGLTIREGLDDTSAQASVMIFPEGGLRMSCRPTDGSTQSALLGGANPLQWVRLVRAGDRFSGFGSPDGQTWELAGTVRVDMSATAYVGLACAATLNHLALGTTFDEIKIMPRSTGPTEGLGLTDGSIIAGQTKRLDREWLTYADANGEERRLPAKAVAFMFTRLLPPDVLRALAKRDEGLSLATGDQIEGSVQGVRDGRVTVTSVLFGRRTLPLEETLAVVLRPTQPSGHYSISTRDGSVYRCTRVRVGEGVVTAEGGITGTVSVKDAALLEINFIHEL